MVNNASKKRNIGLTYSQLGAYLTGLPLFSNLSVHDLKLFSDATHFKQYKRGETLYIEGEKAAVFFVISSGWVRLFYSTDEGEEMNLEIVTRNGIVGESAIFENGRYACTAQAIENAQILRIPIAILNDQLRLNPQFAFNMLNSLNQHQRRHQRRLQQFLQYSAPQRIGSFLLGLCPMDERKDGVKFTLPYDKSLIASTLSMRGPTFSRALHILREKTGVHVVGAQITIHSMERLLKFVKGCYANPHFL